MRVYTEVTIDIASGKVLSEQGFNYTGPVAECKKKKSKTKTTQKIIRSPEEQQLTELRLSQEKAMEPLRAKARTEAEQLLTPSVGLPQGYTVPTGLPGFEGLRFSSPETAFGASRVAAQTDVGALEAAAKRTLEGIVAPQIMASLIASGMGRSGALAEVLGKEGARMALPIAGEARSAQYRLADFITNIGQQRQAYAAGLANPSTQFFPAPTTITTQKTTSGGGFNPLDVILPAASIATAPFTGGTSLMGLGMGAMSKPFGYNYSGGSGFYPIVGGPGQWY